MPGDVLLLSNSRPPGGDEPFGHARAVLASHLGDRPVWFVPYARADHDDYFAWVRRALGGAIDLRPLHAEKDPAATAGAAAAVFVGGGNTFRLLHDVRRLGVLDALRANPECRYTGSSAGTNLGCPTIRTTNDMPIVDPGGLDALARVPFQVNPHYLDPDPASTHQGETREERIAEFHEVDHTPVVGLREGAWLHRAGDTLTLDGNPARLFRRDHGPDELAAGTDLSWLLTTSS
ncbi:dipeptidase PepE [Actinomycetospora sp. TBRC 11914]|uniref:dipeptidase PepE n=1 Tax=Actinomycetospora sp. TBRC 11914 TaxID=2729387 RepID=UPI00145F5148|nr:dipeptidase PepE [Actinomycetospora sp. TBRC 11914]NMO90206.1 dipeptidase PepE [Actinomycetospora sp. TBRC 11914]